MSRTVKCRTCFNWFPLELHGCPHCEGELLEDPKVPYELTEEDIRILRVNGIAPNNDRDDDGS
jgi:hypothetical protein